MKLVLYSTNSTEKAAIEALNTTADTLMDGQCPDVSNGDTISGITDAGSCYNLVVGSVAAGSPETSKFTMDTTGVTSLVIFAQHVPTEFEKDTHYLQDSAEKDIE